VTEEILYVASWYPGCVELDGKLRFRYESLSPPWFAYTLFNAQLTLSYPLGERGCASDGLC